MHKSGLTERVQVASILGHLPSDDELTTRARSILRWKIRYNSVRVVAQNGHVILSGNVLSHVDREAAEQTVRKLTGVVTLTNRITTTLPYITGLHRASAALDQSMDSRVV
jgi:osmotically-inducible protein OsmY